MFQKKNRSRRMQQEASWMQEGSWIGGQNWQEEPAYDDAAGQEQEYAPPYEDGWDDGYAQPMNEPMPEIIATNRTVCLTCTLESMMSLFALFLLFVEKKSRATRHFAVQSVGLLATHLACAAVCLLVGMILGGIPFLGFLMTLICWILYLVILIITLVARVRMMLCAWQGVKFVVPVIGRWLERFC